MQYYVIHSTQNNRRQWATEIDATSDAEALQIALAVLPPDAVLDEVKEILPIAAEHNAALDAAKGYNFRQFVPGTIRTLDDGRFEVCIP